MRQHLAAQPKVSATQAAPPLNLLCLWGPVLWAYNGRGNPVDFQITSGLFFHCFPQGLLLPLRWLTNLIKWFFIHTLRALLQSYMLILFFFFLNFCGPAILFSSVAASLYLSTNCTRRSNFSMSSTTLLYFLPFFKDEIYSNVCISSVQSVQSFSRVRLFATP